MTATIELVLTVIPSTASRQPPTANAGRMARSHYRQTQLNGTATDDGLPAPK
ncbi:MAG: hypothetical protein R2867_39840 [Caldilineaceae bacterium]